MFKNSPAFSGFSVDNLAKAKEFYGKVLEVDLNEFPQGLRLHLARGSEVFIYEKPNHVPATFTILNFPVADIDQAVDELTARGVMFEHYTGKHMETDEKGIVRGGGASNSSESGLSIAWFKDPAGNFFVSAGRGKKQTPA